jgi:dATP pyrophosphohydrolase
MDHKYKRPESVLVVVYTRELDILLLRRVRPADHWQSVTGSLEWGESAADAAARELQEETGICARPVETGIQHCFPILPAWRDRFAPEVKENLEYLFYLPLDQRVEIQLNRKEHDQYQWLDQQQAASLVFSWTNRDAILAIRSQARC